MFRRRDFSPILLEVNNAPELYTKDPTARPVNHRTHLVVLGELIPLLAMGRPVLPARVKRFAALFSARLVGAQLDGAALELCPTSVGAPAPAANAHNMPEGWPAAGPLPRPPGRSGPEIEIGRPLGCISADDIDNLWRSFDEQCSSALLRRVYPVIRTVPGYRDLFIGPGGVASRPEPGR